MEAGDDGTVIGLTTIQYPGWPVGQRNISHTHAHTRMIVIIIALNCDRRRTLTD